MSSPLGKYQLLDCGNGRKLEQLGHIVVDRSAPSANHVPQLDSSKWQAADAKHHKAVLANDRHRWEFFESSLTQKSWPLEVGCLIMNCRLTDFGHIGFFPEQAEEWPWLTECASILQQHIGRPPRILNLFGHTGGSSLALAIGGAHVTHVDSSRSALIQGKDNQKLNKNVPTDSVRWIQDDCLSFLEKEIRRDQHYDGVVLDPPSYGKGIKKGQSFKIESNLESLLDALAKLAQADGLKFLHFSCHTLEFQNTRIQELCSKHFGIEATCFEEKDLKVLCQSGAKALPSGNCVRFIQG